MSRGLCLQPKTVCSPAVGYIIGTPNTKDFARRWKDIFIPVIDPKLVPREPSEDQPAVVKDLTNTLYDADRHFLESSCTLSFSIASLLFIFSNSLLCTVGDYILDKSM